MSKAAVYAGLGQGLMAFGQGAGRAIETMAIENLRQQNLEKNWARQAEEREKDRALQREQIQSMSGFRKETLELRRDGMKADDDRWSAGNLMSQISGLDKSFQDEADALRESLIGNPEELATRIKELRQRYAAQKVQLIESAPAEIVQKAGLEGMYSSLVESLKAPPTETANQLTDKNGESDGFLNNLGGLLGGWAYDMTQDKQSALKEAQAKSAAAPYQFDDYKKPLIPANTWGSF